MAVNPLANMMQGGNNPIANIMNSPVMQLVGALKSGNPQVLFQQMIGQNPQIASFANSARGKTPQQMGNYMAQAAQQKGVDLSQLATQLGMPKEIAQEFGIKI